MFTAFSTALSGLSANAIAVDAIGNNLANLNTAGYKATDLQFHDLMSQALGVGTDNSDVGQGVGPASMVRNFSQGSIQTTGGAFDAAIQGDGFFVVRNQANQTLYTRAGNFVLDAHGNLVTATGEDVQGWSATNGVVNAGGPVANINVPIGAIIPATATTNMSMDVNLDSRAATGTVVTAPLEVIDSQGGSHVLTASFTKTDVNKWDYTVTVPAADLKGTGTNSVAKGSLVFDSSGQLTTPAAGADPSVKIAGLANGAADMTIDWNLYNAAGTGRLTQFAQTSGLSTSTQDGIAAGQISNVSITDGGLVVAKYSNGQQATVAQLAVASVRNPETLQAVGNNNLQATVDTAPPAIGTSDSGGRGKVVGGAIEGSTVDIATEFTNLITMQRSYQANSKVITTSDQMLQDTLNMKQ
jgi:flagellar hook protein FlgE